jgi:ABC-type polysaccharide/polyol phosphate export permease
MAALSTMTTSFGDTLVEGDVSSIPPEPPNELLYRHKVHFIESVRNLWAHREIIYTLAERDFRAQYKQASLGVLWALISPVLTLVIMIFVFSRVKTFGSEGLPYALFAFVGIMCWNFFSTSLGNGGQSLLNNKALMAKTQFPRECFPLETMCVQAVNTMLSWIPLALLFVIFGRAPKMTTFWVPMFMVVEVVFAAGIALAISSIIIQMRDLMQLLPLVTTLGMFATPVIWPFGKIPTSYHVAGGHRVLVRGAHGHLGHMLVGGFTVNLQMVYGFINPLGPVIDGARQTMLLGHTPDFRLMGVAALGAACWLVLGYRIFKRLEEHFADIA